MPLILKIAAIACGLVCYAGLIWFVCRLMGTNGLEDEQ